MSLVPEAIAAASQVLTDAGVPAARANAELLAAYVLGLPRGRLVLVKRFTAEQADRYRQLIEARADRVPLQHLTGTAPFHRVEVAVGPGVFVPRPETELLVEWGVARLTGRRSPVVVDLCSGSGAIALAVAAERPDATVYAVEDSPAALRWLRRNADGTPVRVVDGDATDPAVLSTLDGQVDLVLCNPPYVPAGTVVEPEVGVHDPARAVFAGPDGLAVIRPVTVRAGALLRPGTGWFGVEHDDSHGQAVPALLGAAGGFTAIEDHPDLAGRPRFATARRLADSLP